MGWALSAIIRIRGLEDADKPFIFATWLNHLWYHRDNKTTLPKDTFMGLHHARIERLMKDATCFEVAVIAEDPYPIVGYAVHADKKFIYMKKAWRGLGVETLFRGEKL